MARDGGDDGYKKRLDLSNGLRPKVCSHKEVCEGLDDCVGGVGRRGCRRGD